MANRRQQTRSFGRKKREREVPNQRMYKLIRMQKTIIRIEISSAYTAKDISLMMHRGSSEHVRLLP
jgi:hypothetical protein